MLNRRLTILPKGLGRRGSGGSGEVPEGGNGRVREFLRCVCWSGIVFTFWFLITGTSSHLGHSAKGVTSNARGIPESLETFLVVGKA